MHWKISASSIRRTTLGMIRPRVHAGDGFVTDLQDFGHLLLGEAALLAVFGDGFADAFVDFAVVQVHFSVSGWY